MNHFQDPEHIGSPNEEDLEAMDLARCSLCHALADVGELDREGLCRVCTPFDPLEGEAP